MKDPLNGLKHKEKISFKKKFFKDYFTGSKKKKIWKLLLILPQLNKGVDLREWLLQLYPDLDQKQCIVVGVKLLNENLIENLLGGDTWFSDKADMYFRFKDEGCSSSTKSPKISRSEIMKERSKSARDPRNDKRRSRSFTSIPKLALSLKVTFKNSKLFSFSLFWKCKN